MTAYISVSFSHRQLFAKELDAITGTLSAFGISSLVFVDKYRFTAGQEREMMQQAMKEIESCDLLLAETSDKAIGIGIEAGYAKARGKPVIYLRKKEAAHSTTVSGISDFSIVYNDIEDLRLQLAAAIRSLKQIGQEIFNTRQIKNPGQ